MSVNQIKNRLTSSLFEFRMAILYFVLFSANAIFSAVMIALTNVTWSDLDGQGKFMIVIALLWNWTNTLLAFMSKQAARIKQTGEFFPASDTQFTNKPPTP